ncbi:MAG: alanine--glyoxylate aminotransferase family protein [Synergistes sp.]|nr:alanine--glyoxylate aminotransferase family protein [Synergistes sp.]
MKERFLLTPGPVEVPKSVLNIQSHEMISHRCPAFSQLFTDIEEKLHRLFASDSPVVVLPSSGTGTLECAAVNFLGMGDKFISLSYGVFGQRFRDIAMRVGAHGVFVDAPLGSVPSADEMRAAVSENPDAKAILITHNETSTGVALPIAELLKALPEKHPLVMVDGVSAVGAMECMPEQWGIDVVCTASQKGLITPPGLGLVWLSERALAALNDRECPSYYFDLKLHLKHMKQGNMANPYTSPVSLYRALNEALNIILKDGREAWFAKRRKFADAFAAGLEACGFELFVKDKRLRSAGLTSFTAREGGIALAEVKTKLSELGITLADGQETLKGKILRAAHYSDWGREELAAIIERFAAANGADRDKAVSVSLDEYDK